MRIKHLKTMVVSNRTERPTRQLFCGSFGGFIGTLVGYPLDIIKVRLQTQVIRPGVPPPYRGVLDCGRKILQRDGVRTCGAVSVSG